MVDGFVELALGAVALGLLHGLAPGHGWAIAASYALAKPNRWFYGLAASLILGIGHLISSVAVVAAYFWAISYLGVTELEWLHYVAGAMLIGLGVWQYFHGHEHSHAVGATDPDEHLRVHATGHARDRESSPLAIRGRSDGTEREAGRFERLKRVLPFVGDHDHVHPEADPDRGLYGMAVLAFVLGFTHNEEFDIIAICTGSVHCLELMLLYALAVIVSLVGVTLVLVAGYERFEDRLERHAEHLPTVTAAILVLMGVGFILGVF
ncbi:MAG: hypothetical protein ACOC0X_01150 [Halobacteriota archaeon]